MAFESDIGTVIAELRTIVMKWTGAVVKDKEKEKEHKVRRRTVKELGEMRKKANDVRYKSMFDGLNVMPDDLRARCPGMFIKDCYMRWMLHTWEEYDKEGVECAINLLNMIQQTRETMKLKSKKRQKKTAAAASEDEEEEGKKVVVAAFEG